MAKGGERRHATHDWQRLSEIRTRLPRQDVIHDASTSELQKHLECDVLLASTATPSRKRRSDKDENTAAATAGKKWRRNASGRVNRSPRTISRKGTRLDVDNLPRQKILDQWAGLATMVGGRSTRPRPPVLTPRGGGRSPTIGTFTTLTTRGPADSMLLMQRSRPRMSEQLSRRRCRASWPKWRRYVLINDPNNEATLTTLRTREQRTLEDRWHPEDVLSSSTSSTAWYLAALPAVTPVRKNTMCILAPSIRQESLSCHPLPGNFLEALSSDFCTRLTWDKGFDERSAWIFCAG